MIHLAYIRVGRVEEEILELLVEGVEARLDVPGFILREVVDPAFALLPSRGQHYSTALLKHLLERFPEGESRIVGITELDISIPILTFVFGEAQLDGRVAVVSLCRLRQEFYGLPADKPLLLERALKEALHELGHNFGLRHCRDYNCVMRASNAVEDIDVKGVEFCADCRGVVNAALGRRP